ncbi:P-loop containing nucleoside triphosphate hydrolase protein [Baffinella frigidus]|nr:P-loop containing nucleoside triphosphate hydrolase protein [Cryptophyta sp. CCMP2293]
MTIPGARGPARGTSARAEVSPPKGRGRGGPQLGAEEEYKALTMELLDMSEELDQMGGGDTQLAKLSVVVRLRPPKRLDGGERAVWIEGDEVHVSDAAKASDLNKPGGDRVYQVTRALPAHASQRDTYVAAALPAIDFVWEGFNASIMAMGQVGTGKTRTLFGGGGQEGLCELAVGALLDRIVLSQDPEDLAVGALLDRIFLSQDPEDFTLALSIWEVGVSQVTDLLREDPAAPMRADNGSKGFASLRVRSQTEAVQVLALTD